MDITFKYLMISFSITLLSFSCIGQEINEKRISEEEIKDRFEGEPEKWIKFEKEANRINTPKEKVQALISYGRWRLYRPGGQINEDRNKEGFSERILETMIHMEKTNGRGYGGDLFTFGLDNSYHATGADYGRSVEEGTYTINTTGTKITENFMFTSRMHELKGKKQQAVFEILYLKGDYMILRKGRKLMYLYRV